jgi:hypothetical protein
MTNPKEPVFYTYAWLRESGTPYYIGKGCGRRAFIKRKWKPPKERILILKKNLTEAEALRHERYMIFVLGRKSDGGLLYNLAEGGEVGNTGLTRSLETKSKMSDTRKGKPLAWPESRSRIMSEEQKEKLRKAQTGKKHTPETLNKLREAGLRQWGLL